MAQTLMGIFHTLCGYATKIFFLRCDSVQEHFGFVLDDELAAPEQVNGVGVALQVADIGFKRGDGCAPDAEHFEKLVVKRLLVGAFGRGVLPVGISGKADGTVFYLVP
jgi:hypothetical protein